MSTTSMVKCDYCDKLEKPAMPRNGWLRFQSNSFISISQTEGGFTARLPETQTQYDFCCVHCLVAALDEVRMQHNAARKEL